MKKTLTVLSLFIFFTYSLLNAQPLNGSFENWNANDPVDWFSSDEFGVVDGIIQSPYAHDGSSSAHLEVVDLGGGIPFAPYIWSMDDNGNFHSVSEKHGSLTGWYQYSPQGNDLLIISVGMMTSDTVIVGAGGWTFQSSVSSWTSFDIPITYTQGSADPTQTLITIGIYDSTGQPTVGSYALIDHLSFTDPSYVEQISGIVDNFVLKQNYPNPFNPSTNIEYSIPEASFVQLKVYDILGNEVASLVNEDQNAGVYRADFTAGNLASGFYIAQLKAGNYTKTIKMALLK